MMQVFFPLAALLRRAVVCVTRYEARIGVAIMLAPQINADRHVGLVTPRRVAKETNRNKNKCVHCLK